ncbi:MAG: four helix bundle protein [Verrucomicrobiota bacterium]
MNSNYDLEERLLEFAAETVRLCETLPRTESGRHMAKQLMKSATSPLAHHGEAQAAESRNDFIHKMKIAHKELRESIRWMRLIHRVPLLSSPETISPLISEADQLIRIFHASVRTAQTNHAS